MLATVIGAFAILLTCTGRKIPRSRCSFQDYQSHKTIYLTSDCSPFHTQTFISIILSTLLDP